VVQVLLMDKVKVVFRTDSSLKIGTGHLMRCLTLAERLRESDAEVQFVCRNHYGNLIELVRQKEFIVNELPSPENFESSGISENNSEYEYENLLETSQEQDAQETSNIMQKNKPDWLIVDHYALGQNWENQMRPHVHKIMVIDDLANRRHDCDMLLDQNYFIEGNSRYKGLVPPTCTKLLGPQYALLRPAFAEARKYLKPRTGKVQRVFVFFGGIDSKNVTEKSLEALSAPEFSHLDVCVVIGSHNPHRTKIEQQVKTRLRTQLNVQIENIAELMAQNDLALGAGGSTAWERMALGLPSIVVTIANNQVAFTENLDKDGYVKWLGNADQVDEQIIYTALLDAINNSNQLKEQSRKCQKLVNGKGAELIAELLTTGTDPEKLSVRKAKLSDASLYWHWANDSAVRESAFNQKTIEWQEHQEWFENSLNNSETLLLLIECSFGAIGQVRFDRSGSHYTIDYSLAKQFRGFGLAKVMFSKAIDYLRKEKAFTLIGEIKGSNAASKKVFEHLGFTESPPPKKRCEPFSITVLSDRTTWMRTWIGQLMGEWAEDGNQISWVHNPSEVPEGTLCFILSCSKIVKLEILNRNSHNLVVHESALPKGRGWSPLSWQILEGNNTIPITLFEAEKEVDSGVIYLQEHIDLNGDELVNELREKQAIATLDLCRKFVKQYPSIVKKAKVQSGESSFYTKRTPIDSMIDPNKTIVEQFNLLRIVDNERYPAYFDWLGQRYFLRIEKDI
jgi:UDP-2,4-diacetamido-2,4,6-trideoxy-beta-L-altropyranose hydrolase